ncbi:MAG: ABC transporter permease [Aristaeellaceae bacterium]
MRAVFRHELQSYFTTPVGYVFLLMYTLLTGVVVVSVNIGQEMSASMNLTLSAMQLPLMLITPLLTMRLFAEERRMRTDQLLFTVPVRCGAIVMGKMLAAMVLLALSMGLTLIYPAILSRYAQISLSQVLTVYLGYFLLNMSLLGMGVLLSSLCVHQVSAAVLTLGVNLTLYLCEHYAVPRLTASYLAPLRMLLGLLPSSDRLGDFANGIISLSDMVYFLALTGLMLFFTDRVLEYRRAARR